MKLFSVASIKTFIPLVYLQVNITHVFCHTGYSEIKTFIPLVNLQVNTFDIVFIVKLLKLLFHYIFMCMKVCMYLHVYMYTNRHH